MQAVLAVDVVGNGENGLLISGDGLADALDRHGDAVVGGALLLDDLVSGVLHFLGDAVHVALMVGMAAQLAEIVERDAGDVRQAPCRDLAIAVLADDTGVHVARVNAQMLAQGVLEARGVERGAATEHAVGGHARELEGHVGQDVHGVRDHQQDALIIALGDLRDDGLEDGDVLVDQIEARLAGRLVRPGRDHGDGRIVDIGVVARVDVHGAAERHAVRDVEGLALGAVVVDVDEDHLREQARLHEGEGAGRAHEPAADDGHLARIDDCCHGCSYPLRAGRKRRFRGARPAGDACRRRNAEPARRVYCAHDTTSWNIRRGKAASPTRFHRVSPESAGYRRHDVQPRLLHILGLPAARASVRAVRAWRPDVSDHGVSAGGRVSPYVERAALRSTAADIRPDSASALWAVPGA